MFGYHTHEIYCDLNYRSLISIAADYFQSNHFLDYWGEKRFKNNNQFVTDSGDKATFFCIYSRSLVDLSAGIVVTSENLKGKFSRQELSKDFLPQKVSQRFTNFQMY